MSGKPKDVNNSSPSKHVAKQSVASPPYSPATGPGQSNASAGEQPKPLVNEEDYDECETVQEERKQAIDELPKDEINFTPYHAALIADRWGRSATKRLNVMNRKLRRFFGENKSSGGDQAGIRRTKTPPSKLRVYRTKCPCCVTLMTFIRGYKNEIINVLGAVGGALVLILVRHRLPAWDEQLIQTLSEGVALGLLVLTVFLWSIVRFVI